VKAGLLLAAAVLCIPIQAAVAAPNIVVIMSDDQDDEGDINVMPNLQQLATQGVRFANTFSAFATCAPDRASFLTGQYPHNHGVYDNATGWIDFSPHEANSLGVWLQGVGYTTALMGKYINQYATSRYDPTYVPPGWSEWDAVAGKINDFDYDLNENGTIQHYGTADADYLTDVIDAKAVTFLQNQQGATQPFFLLLTPHAPHKGAPRDLAVPAPRDVGTFAKLPYTFPENYDEKDVSDKPAFIQAIKNMGLSNEQIIKVWHSRLESLLAVDKLVGDVVTTLQSTGEASNTIVIYTSDNGFSLGSHRWFGKGVIYEESARVPLIVSWPGMLQNQTSPALVSFLDITATIVDAAGATAGNPLDGASLTSLLADISAPWRTALLVEGRPEANMIRTPDFVYNELSDGSGDRELYDLSNDTSEMINRIDTLDVRLHNAETALANILSNVKLCAGASCWISTSAP